MINKLMVSLAIVLSTGLFTNPVLAQEPPQCDQVYTVQAGDWLSKIAEEYYGDPLAFDRIVEANNAQSDDAYPDIANPDLIEPGLVLCLPAVDVMTQLTELAGAAPPGLSPGELANATYPSQYTPSGSVTLDNGRFSEPAAPGSATEITVSMTRYLAYGELNGQPSAAVVLVSDPGGSGTFYDLYVMVSQNGQPMSVASTTLGDRVQTNSIAIENNQIMVDMVQAGPNDPLCCPSQQVINTYELQGDQLVEVSSQEVSSQMGQDTSSSSQSNEPKLVWVDKVEIQMVDGEYLATLTGNYPDGCSTLGEIETTVAGDTISVTVFADSPPGVMCTSVLVPFEETIALDLGEVEPGEYTVVVNEAATTTLTVN